MLPAKVNVPHIEYKRKNINNMCGKKFIIQIIQFIIKLFLMKKFQQSKKEQNN